MDKYENLGMLGEGSYGMVMKCKHKDTGQVVAIKKFLETEDDKMVKKISLREVRMLKQLRHENLVNLIEVFRRKKRLFLVFEFVDRTALDDLERNPTGTEEIYVKKVMWQVLKGVEFCHLHNVIHRDVKPENILISRRGVVKLCDFGFARAIAPPGEVYTDYVATRWYRAPELLVGDTSYGRAVDVWAIGALFSEMLTGDPLFPGESDIDQLHLITKCFGNLIGQHREIFRRNPLFIGMRLPEARELEPLERRYRQLSPASLDIIKWSLRLDPHDRPTCSQLLRHELFTKNNWSDKFSTDLRSKVEKEFQENPLILRLGITIHGSVHEAKQREMAEKKVQQAVSQIHADAATGHDHAAAREADTKVRRKEKKRKPKKEMLLQAREKPPKERQQHSIDVQISSSSGTTEKLPLTSSQHSLTASNTHTQTPRSQTPQKLPQTLHSPTCRGTLLIPLNGSQRDGLSSQTPSSTHQSRLMQPISSTPTKYLTFKSPPTSITHLGLKQVVSEASNSPSSPRGNATPDLLSKNETGHRLLINQDIPSSLSSTGFGSMQHHTVPSTFKRHMSKSKDPLLLPFLKEQDNSHSRTQTHPSFSKQLGHSMLEKGPKSGIPQSNRSYLLATIPHFTHLDGIRESPTASAQHPDRNMQRETSTTFPIV